MADTTAHLVDRVFPEVRQDPIANNAELQQNGLCASPERGIRGKQPAKGGDPVEIRPPYRKQNSAGTGGFGVSMQLVFTIPSANAYYPLWQSL